MKNKKGFTLVELLAVIVILAIIALIATPIILNVIDEAKKGASESSVQGYLDALEKQMVIEQVNEKDIITDGTHQITSLTNIKVNGDKPTSGWVYIEKSNIKYYSLYVGGYTVTKTNNKETTVKGENVVENKVVCKRATKLHEEECKQTSTTSFCSGAGYTATGSKETTTIKYGNLGKKGKLVSGDAFDCDVDGDEDYNENTERFYYVSGRDGNSDSDYAVLIYYNNTKEGIPNNSSSGRIEYNTSNINNLGPEIAVTNLPTTDQWSNVSLYSTKRQIKNEVNGTTSNNGAATLVSFDYTNHSTRLLTVQEINKACNMVVGSNILGELDNCPYLFENTKYSSDEIGTYGFWLETPYSADLTRIWSVYGNARRVSSDIGEWNTGINGVRPVIEVLKNEIDY